MEVGKLWVKLGLDNSEYTSKIDESKEKAGGLSSFLRNAFEFTVGQGMFDVIKTGLKDAWDMSFGFNNEMQQSQIAFESMLGDSERAQDMMSQLSKMAADTPFELPELTTATKKLQAFKFSAAEIPDMLTKIGDASAGLSLGSEGVSRLTLALGQMKAKGKVTAEEMMQLTEAGVPAWDILSKAMNKSTSEVMKLSERGLIPADMAIRQLLNGMEETFPNMMDKQSKSFKGLMSTLKDNTQMTLGEIMKPMFDDLTNNILPALIQKVQNLNDAMKTDGMKGVLNEIFPPGITTIIMGIGNAIKSVFNFAIEHGKLVKTVVSGVVGAFLAYKGAVVAATIGMQLHGIAVAISAVKSIGLSAATEALAVNMKDATVAQWGLNTAMNANPIMAIITLVGLIAGAFIGYKLTLGATKNAEDDYANSAIANIQKVKQASLDALDKEMESQRKKVNDDMALLDESHSNKLNKIQEEYNAQVEGLQDQEKALRESVQNRKKILDEQHNDAIQKIRDYYGVASETSYSLTDVTKRNAERQKEILEDRYNKEIKAIEETTKAKIDSINEEIRVMDEKAKEEDRAEKDAKDNKKLRILQDRLQNAKSVTEKSIIETQMANTEKEINKRKDEVLRQEQKKHLQKQIEELRKNEEQKKNILQKNLENEKKAIDKATQAKIDQIQKERKAKEAAENAKYKAAKESLEKEEKALQGWSKRQKKVLDAQLKHKQEIENAMYKAEKERLERSLEDLRKIEEKKRKEIEKTAKAQEEAEKAKSSGGFWSGVKEFFTGSWGDAPNLRKYGAGFGYATGTDYASPGLHWVGENGPELVDFKGGERVQNSRESRDISSSSKPNLIQVFLDGTMIHEYYDRSQGRNLAFESRRVGL
ncbi:TPA: tape measure protein [Clostridium botulinum]|nr:tape measure protein [Clostridium botulinum]